jgi:DNA-binding SARP family transcriptional activator
MASDAVVSRKVRRPPPSGLRRGRLLSALIGAGSADVTVLIAPAGCGKTTLLAQAAATIDAPAAWYRVEPDDTSEAALVRHVATALGRACAASLPATTVDELLDQLEQWPDERVLLVVDDVQEVAGTPADRALGRLVALRPPWLRMLLASRRRPTFNVSRMQVADDLHHLDDDDLRFRSWEVERLFRDVYGEPLPPESAAALTRRTGGWAAGLQLFHLATTGRTTAERREAVASLSGRSRLIRSYLTENVLSELRPELRSFLVRTAGLTLLSGPMCDALLDASGSQTLLHELEAAHLFTTSSDGGLTFRYHQVLQDHLEVALQDELMTGARAWYRRSAAVLEAFGHFREALRAYACAEEWGAVAQLLDRAGATLLEGSPAGWDALGAVARDVEDPWLTLVGARRNLRRGELARAVEGYRRAEELLPDPTFQAQCRHERGLAALWLPSSSSRPAEARGRHTPRHWAERVRAATVRVGPAEPAPRPRESGDGLADGLVRLLRGDVHDAITRLAAVSDAAPGDSFEGIAALTAGALAELLVGRGDVEKIEQVALAADVAEQPWLVRLIRTCLDVLLPSPGQEDGGALPDAVQQCRRTGDDWGAALLLFLHGARARRTGGADAVAALTEAEDLFTHLGAPVPAVWARALRGKALAERGDPAAGATARSAEAAARQLGVGGARMVARSVILTDRPEHAPARAARPVAVRLTLLGNFSLEVSGQPVAWCGVRPRALTLLRLMSVTLGADVHRETLMEALWPEAPVEMSTHRLQVAVSSLRRALDAAGLPGSELLSRHGEAYRFSLPPGARVDVHELELALTDASAARAEFDLVGAGEAHRHVLRLYAGDLLPGDGPAEWVVGPRGRLRRRVADGARALAEDCLVLADLRGGVEAATRSLDLDPFQDGVWALLEQLHGRAGDRAAAEGARRSRFRVVADLASAPDGRRVVGLPRPRLPAPRIVG